MRTEGTITLIPQGIKSFLETIDVDNLIFGTLSYQIDQGIYNMRHQDHGDILTE